MPETEVGSALLKVARSFRPRICLNETASKPLVGYPKISREN